MPKFQVCSGSVKVTILAEDPYSAAVELIESRSGRNGGNASCSSNRGMGEQIIVRQADERRSPERFITMNLVAHVNRQTPRDAWRKKMARFDPNNN